MIKYGKYVVVVLLLIFLVLLIGREHVEDVPLAEVEASIGTGASIGTMKKADAKMLRRYYSLEEEDVKEYLVYVPSGQMEVEELAVFKGKDGGQTERIVKQVQTRLDNQKKSFSGYGVEQTALLNKAVLMKKGTYVLFAVSPKAEQWKECFLQCITKRGK